MTVPASSGTADVSVTTPSGTSPAVPADEFTFLAVTGVSPSSGQPPLTVTIFGSGFATGPGNTAVLFGGRPAAGVAVAPGGTELTALLPAGSVPAGFSYLTPFRSRFRPFPRRSWGTTS